MKCGGYNVPQCWRCYRPLSRQEVQWASGYAGRPPAPAAVVPRQRPGPWSQRPLQNSNPEHTRLSLWVWQRLEQVLPQRQLSSEGKTRAKSQPGPASFWDPEVPQIADSKNKAGSLYVSVLLQTQTSHRHWLWAFGYRRSDSRLGQTLDFWNSPGFESCLLCLPEECGFG